MSGEKFPQPFEPLELVLESRTLPIISLRYVGVNDRDSPKDPVYQSIPVCWSPIIETGRDLLGLLLRCYCHTIVPLLPLEDDVIPRVFKFFNGEFIVLHLGLLHTEDCRAVLLKPRYDDVESRTYGVHIIGGDLDGSHGYLHGFETHFSTIN